MELNNKNVISCITFSHLFTEAESYLTRAYPNAQLLFYDIRKLVLKPLGLLKLLSTECVKAVGFVSNSATANGLDLIGTAVFVTRARSKSIIDCEGTELPLGTAGGIKHILRCLADIATLPLAVVFFSLRASVLLSKSGRQTDIKLKLGGKTTFVYFRTDTFEELRAGGSVAHTTGVISGFMEQDLTPLYISPYLIKSVADMNIPMHRLKQPAWFRNIPELPSLLYSEYLFRRVQETFTHQPVSFIYQRYALNNYTGLLCSQKYHLPFILEYNGPEVWVARNWGTPLLFEKIAANIEIANLRAASIVVVVSAPIKDELVARGINSDKVLVNPNGVDPDLYSPSVDGSHIRTQYDLIGKIVIGFIGTFGKWHGAEVLAEAFGLLLKEYPAYRESIRLLMIGDGMTMPLVKERLAKYAVGDACILAGRIPQEDGPAHLAACDILASPHVPNADGTPFFGSPTKLFEYMAMGKGIVASDLDQIGEILKHEQAAWMVKPGDADSLMLGLKMLIDHPELRQRLGMAAREEVVARYTWKEHTRKIIEKLRETVREEPLH